jgi:assimilatory nitrate reductase catalytic subunit
MIVKAAEIWGPASTSFLLHARGIEHHSKGVLNCMAAINLVVATGRIGREGCGYAMITGQGNGQGGREQGQKCDQLPGGRDIENPEHRKYIASVWGVPEESIPHKGLSMVPIFEAIHAGKIKGLLAISCNPMVSLPNNAFIREACEKLEFFAQVDFFLSETARYADVVLAGSLMEEDEGTTTNVEGRVIHHKKAVTPPEDARADWKIICEIAGRLGYSETFKYESPKEIFDELRVASKGGVSDYYGITWERIDREKGVFWPCPSPEHPGTPRLYEGNKFNHPDGKAHFQAVEWKPAAEETDSEYPIILTTGRVVSHYLSGTQTRRIGALVDQYPQPVCEIHPLLAGKLGISEGDFVKVESRRGGVTVRANVVKTIRPDTVFVPYHWPLDRAANNMTVRAIDPISNIPEYKICAVRVSKVPAPHDAIAELEMQAGGVR